MQSQYGQQPYQPPQPGTYPPAPAEYQPHPTGVPQGGQQPYSGAEQGYPQPTYQQGGYGQAPSTPLYPPPDPSLAPTPWFRQRRTLAVLGAIAALALIGGLLVNLLTGSTPQPLTIDVGLLDADSSCSGGAGGYSDIGPGQPVTVKDENGKILASTVLPDTGSSVFGCVWTMQVLVPGDAQQYGIEMGRRGTVTFSHDKLVADHWKAELSIGG
jgi:hypothetical protein